MPKACTILFLLLAGFLTTANGQQIDYVFRHLTRDDQLASNHVNAVLKDHNGFMWFATANGLQKYDGKRFVTYQHIPNDSTSLRDNSAISMMEDREHELWIWTPLGVCIYNRTHDNFKSVNIDFDKKRSDFYYSFGLIEDSKGNKWTTLYPGGLFWYDPNAHFFVPYTKTWPACDGNVFRISEDANTGNYWLATDSGLTMYNSKTREYFSRRHNPANLRIFNDTVVGKSNGLLYSDPNRILWLAFWSPTHQVRYYRYDVVKDKLEEIAQNLGYVVSFLTDASGVTWAVGDKLLRFSDKERLFVEIEKKRTERLGLDFNQMYSLYEDDERNLWAGTDLGTFIFNPVLQKFSTATTYSYNQKKSIDGDINGFLQLRDGNIIALGWGADGLYFYDSVMNQLPYQYGYNCEKIKDNNHRLTWCGLEDSQGKVWIGCQSGRLMRIDTHRKKIEFLHPPEFDDRTVRSIVEDKHGNIWFGTQNNVIVKWLRSTGKFQQIMPPPPGKYDLHIILRLLTGKDNDLWVSSNSGLLRLNIDNGEVIDYFTADRNKKDSLQSNGINEILWWDNHTLALATSVGIEMLDLDSRKFSPVTEGSRQFPGLISSMIKDDEENIWFTSSHGISKLHLPSRQVTNYGYREGITDEYFYAGSVASLRNGMLAFGSIRKIVYFKPEDVREKSPPPDVHITGFTVFSRSLPVDSLLQGGNTVELDYQQNFITIRFSSMSNTINDRLDYFWQMVGLDKGWVKADVQQEAQFTYLPGGKYRFKVKCVSPEGIACENITTLFINITPPYWQRPWFFVLCGALVLAIIYALYRIRINRILEIGRMRSRIARDLHDDMGSTLSTISILSEMARIKVHTDVNKTGEYIEKISDNSTRMMEAMDDIVWSINPANDSMQKITARMREFANGVLEARDIEFGFQVDEAIMDLKLNPEARRDFFLIFKEAINNLAKYAQCKQAWASVRLMNNWLEMIIQDDGKGFDVETADGGNGLVNMKKRAQSLRGNIEIVSRPCKGTQVILEFPVT